MPLFQFFDQNRRENVYVVSDMARKTAKFLEAKKSNIPCVKYEWIDESIEQVRIDSSSENDSLLFLFQGTIQDWEMHKLVLPEKETKKSRATIDDDSED